MKVVLVLSGKGGVGKSSISVALASHLISHGCSVGLLDLDLCGPSLACILNAFDASIIKDDNGKWLPYKHSSSLKCVSMAFLLSTPDSAIIWRGARKNALIKELCLNVDWGDCQYLIVDTPPGIQDEHITLAEQFYNNNQVSAVIVTTPHSLSIDDVKRQITFCQKTAIRLIGIVENMKQFQCPHCKECMEIFYGEKVDAAALSQGVEYLGSIDIIEDLSNLGHEKKLFVLHSGSSAYQVFENILLKLN